MVFADDDSCGGPFGFRVGTYGGDLSVRPHSIPYNVAIVENTMNPVPFCSGTLISPNFVLTTAHCVSGRPLTSFRLTMGEHDHKVAGDGERFARVSAIFQHPKYHGPENSNYDFALLKLAEPIDLIRLRNVVGLACLPASTSEMYVDSDVTVSGWISEDSGIDASTRLQASVLSSISQEDCQSLVENQDLLDHFLCVGRSDGADQLCHGFEGGCLLCRRPIVLRL